MNNPLYIDFQKLDTFSSALKEKSKSYSFTLEGDFISECSLMADNNAKHAYAMHKNTLQEVRNVLDIESQKLEKVSDSFQNLEIAQVEKYQN